MHPFQLFYVSGTNTTTKIYRIGLSEAPLPIERYISNFVCEVPLPPQGQVRALLVGVVHLS